MNWTAIKGTCSSIALLAVSFLAVNTVVVENRTAKHVNELLMQTGDVVGNINTTVKKINAPGGLLQVTGKTVAKADNLLGHTDILVANEQHSLDNWNTQITKTLSNVDLAVATTIGNENEITKASAQTLNATTESVKAIKPLADNLAIEAQELQKTTAAVTDLVSDPKIKDTVSHVDNTATHIDGTTADVQHAVHKYVYPGPFARIWGYVSGVGVSVGKLFIP
jgi:hypothetical protein